jgi:hypothetical protein
MGALTSLDLWVVLAVTLVAIIAFAAITNWVIGRALGPGPRDRAGTTAAAYMTALGSLFAILTGFLISSEYLTLRDARNALGAEVAAASQLAQASGSLTPADTGKVQEDLTAYLSVLPTGEWSALEVGAAGASPAAERLRSLQSTVFRVTSKSYVPGPAASSLQESVNAITTSRRQRLVIASSGLPFPLFALSLLAGLALIVNSLLVSARQGARYGLVAAGIVLAVALDLGAILAISAPFTGAFVVDTAPVTELLDELARGAYLPWVNTP